MADEQNTEPSLEETTAAASEQTGSRVKKKVGSRTSKASAGTVASPSSKVAAPRSKRRSDEDKLEIVRQIEAYIADGGTTLKDAVKSVGISDQTYYQWKKAAATAAVDPIEDAPAPSDDGFAEFTALEEENQRLRKLLAEKLRAENAELRKRLGLN